MYAVFQITLLLTTKRRVPMENLIFTKENKIGILTFNRPESKNSLDAKTYDELFELIPQIDKDEDVRVLIITGAGDSFCAGNQSELCSLFERRQPGMDAMVYQKSPGHFFI
jgi:enoyl-CoA hydratase